VVTVVKDRADFTTAITELAVSSGAAVAFRLVVFVPGDMLFVTISCLRVCMRLISSVGCMLTPPQPDYITVSHTFPQENFFVWPGSSDRDATLSLLRSEPAHTSV
jgi:hypothetical protein